MLARDPSVATSSALRVVAASSVARGGRSRRSSEDCPCVRPDGEAPAVRDAIPSPPRERCPGRKRREVLEHQLEPLGEDRARLHRRSSGDGSTPTTARVRIERGDGRRLTPGNERPLVARARRGSGRRGSRRRSEATGSARSAVRSELVDVWDTDHGRRRPEDVTSCTTTRYRAARLIEEQSRGVGHPHSEQRSAPPSRARRRKRFRATDLREKGPAPWPPRHPNVR